MSKEQTPVSSGELMIGNIVEHTNSSGTYRLTILECLRNGINTRAYGQVWEWFFRYEEVYGIPLTPEILEKCGFESGNDDGYSSDWRYNGICIVGIVDDFIEDMTGTKLYYLHQLQNLYYALTGSHLKVDEI